MGQYLTNKVDTMPSAIALEQAVLGALMLDKNAVVEISAILKPTHFYLQYHSWIYEAMLQLFDKSLPIDLLTVGEELGRMGKLKKIKGGPSYLVELTNRVASAANIEYHSRIILQKFIRRAVMLISRDFTQLAHDDQQDALEILENFEKAVFDVQGHFYRQNTLSLADVAAKRLKERDEAKKRGESGIAGLPTYFESVDQIIGGFKNSDLIVFAARPGMGKTAFVLSCAKQQAESTAAIGFFSLEMSAAQLLDRMIAMQAEIVGSKISNNALSETEEALYNHHILQIAELDFHIDDTPSLHINELCAKARRLKKFQNIKAIYIDYLQLITADGVKSVFNREQEIAHISRRLKALAKELDIPVIALSQLSRAVETRGGDKRPQLSDLRESGQIEQDCDVIGFIYRPEYYQILEDEEGQSLKGQAEIIIAKNRHGALKTAKLKFDGPFTRFSELTDDFELDFAHADQNIIITRPSKINDDEDILF